MLGIVSRLLQIHRLATPLLHRDTIELLPDVAETLAVLGTRNDVRLLTKGDADEQRANLEASGLTGYFGHVHIVAEKPKTATAGCSPTATRTRPKRG